MKGRSQLEAGTRPFPGEALCSSRLVSTSIWGKTPASSPAEQGQRPFRLALPSLWHFLWGSSSSSNLTQHPLPWGSWHMPFHSLERRVLNLGALLHCTLPPPFRSLSAGFRNQLLNDPACITLKSTQLLKGSLLPDPSPPKRSTSDSAKITEAPLALENRQPTQPGLSATCWSSAINQA